MKVFDIIQESYDAYDESLQFYREYLEEHPFLVEGTAEFSEVRALFDKIHSVKAPTAGQEYSFFYIDAIPVNAAKILMLRGQTRKAKLVRVLNGIFELEVNGKLVKYPSDSFY